MRDFSKSRSVPNARLEMSGVVIPHLHFLTTQLVAHRLALRELG